MNRTALIAALVLVAILGALAGWYAFLRVRTSAVREADTARGFGIPAPSSVGGVLGGTSGNISYSLGGQGSLSSLQAAQMPGPTDWTATSTEQSAITATSTAKAPFKAHFSRPTKTPIAGFGFVSHGTATRLIWAERATGYVFAADLATGEAVRLTNTLRPKVYEALFDDRGVIERGIAEDGSVETFLGTLGAATTSTAEPAALSGSLIEDGIATITTTPSAQSGIFFTRIGKDGDTEVVVAQRDGKKGKVVFSSPISGWRPIALSDGRLIVAQQPATGVLGFAYEIGKGGVLSSLVQGAQGLIVLPRAWGSALTWSISDKDGTMIFVRANAESEPSRLSLATAADKCVWAPPPVGASAKKPGALIAYCAVPKTPPGPNFLEERYQGALHTEDRWWKVDAASGSIEPLYNGSEAFDVRNPAIDPSGRYLAFIDADDSLWLMQIAP